MNRQNVIDMAAVIPSREYTKKAVFGALMDAMNDNRSMTEAEMAQLYAYFMPKTPAKPKTPEAWVALAMAKNDVREYLQFLYSDGKRLMATDGHRLHIVPTELPEGYYDKQLNKLENIEYRYPEVDRVIPENYSMTLDPKELKAIHYGTEDGKAPRVAWAFGELAINKPYLDQALLGFPMDQLIKHGGKDKAILIEDGEGRLAVIMPVRI